MIFEKYSKLTIGDIVADDFRTASVFTESGIDFCCGGKQTLDEACRKSDVDPGNLIQRIEKITRSSNVHTHNFKEWDLGFLCDYIVNTHHKFVKSNLPELIFYTQKIAMAHGENHPELDEVAELMVKVNGELLRHMQKEEEMLFPAIKQALNKPVEETMQVIATEIVRMTGEHDFVGSAMHKINELTQSYLLPEDACGTYQVALNMLKQFEDDLHIHVHLENNIVFPKALNLKD